MCIEKPPSLREKVWVKNAGSILQDFLRFSFENPRSGQPQYEDFRKSEPWPKSGRKTLWEALLP